MAAENRPFDAQAQLDEREMRLAISVYGYMKRLAAIVGLRNGTEEVGLSETVERLNHMLGRVHNPLAWETDVECRMAEMRMGQS